MHHRIKLIKGDITTLRTDAIVNAANTSLLGGGGVDGAIHAAAGHELLKECASLNGCRTGEAKITKGYKLPARYVIHTVGPVWHGGSHNEDELLAACYRNSLLLAVRNNIRTIALPNISTGVYHFPMPRAAKIAINEVLGFLKTDETLEQVVFVCFGNENFNLYSRLLEESGIDFQDDRNP